MIDTRQLKERLIGAIWRRDSAALPWWQRKLLGALRVGYAVVRDLAGGQLTLRAMSLVYTTLLSLVPLLAVSFSVLKGFGVHNQIEPLIMNLLEPLGEKGFEIGSRIIEFVENIKVGVLGSVGLGLLLYTVVSLIQKIERAFNYTWHVKQQRPFAQRFSDYLSVIAIGPVLVFSALGLTASIASATLVQELMAIKVLGNAIALAGRLIPYLLIIAAFTFIYSFLPNTKVRLGSALTGALVAGVLWETSGWAFASFVVNSTKYTAIYSAFATLIIFMIWLYLGWLILLVGASIAFYHQHPEYLSARHYEFRLSNRLREKLALLTMLLIGQNYYHGRPPWTLEAMAQRLRVPMDAMAFIVESMVRGGLLAHTADEPPGYLPARPLETTQLKDVLAAVRAADEESYLTPDHLPVQPAVEELINHIEGALDQALRGQTLKDLALSDTGDSISAPEPAPQPAAPSRERREA